MALVVGLSGIIGTIFRVYLGKWILARAGANFPWGTWIINITGSFILGVLSGMHNINAIPEWLWLMLGTGFCGAYTTFSTFGYETAQLILKGSKYYSAVYVISSVVLGVLFTWLGTIIVSF